MKFSADQFKQTLPWAIGGLAGLFFFGNLATSFYIEQTLAKPRRRKDNKTSNLDNFVPEFRYSTKSVRFCCDDGLNISALLLRPEKPNGHAVLVCHGIAHDKKSGVRFVQFLLRQHYTLLLIDFRNHGESDGNVTTYGYYEKRDLLAALRYLRDEERIDGRIGILGASMGAAIAVQAAAECEDISALVLDSPFASLRQISTEMAIQTTGLPKYLLTVPMQLAFFWMWLLESCNVVDVEPSEKIKNVKCPVFLIHGTADSKIPVHHSKQIYDNAPAEKELWISEGIGHLGTYLAFTDDYHKRVLSFFDRHLANK